MCDTPLGTFPASYSLLLDSDPGLVPCMYPFPLGCPTCYSVYLVHPCHHVSLAPPHSPPRSPLAPPILRSQLSLSQRAPFTQIPCLTLLSLRQCLFICMCGQQLWKTGSAVSAKPRGPCRKPFSNRWMNVTPSPCQDRRVP